MSNMHPSVRQMKSQTSEGVERAASFVPGLDVGVEVMVFLFNTMMLNINSHKNITGSFFFRFIERLWSELV